MKKEKRTRIKEEKERRDGKQRDRERDPYFLVRQIKGEKNAGGREI